MQEQIYVGLDLGSSQCQQAVIGADGRLRFSRIVATSEQHLRLAFDGLEAEASVHLEAGELSAWVAMAKRRHAGQNRFWIKDKYFTTRGGDHWVFFGQATDKDGKSKNLHIFKAASVPIKRHTKVRAKANPYSPEWETYFEHRLDVQMKANLKGYKRLLSLWYEQNGICPICDDKITKITRLAQPPHYPSCSRRHRRKQQPCSAAPKLSRDRVHSKGLEVVKPRLKRGIN